MPRHCPFIIWQSSKQVLDNRGAASEEARGTQSSGWINSNNTCRWHSDPLDRCRCSGAPAVKGCNPSRTFPFRQPDVLGAMKLAADLSVSVCKILAEVEQDSMRSVRHKEGDLLTFERLHCNAAIESSHRLPAHRCEIAITCAQQVSKALLVVLAKWSWQFRSCPST